MSIKFDVIVKKSATNLKEDLYNISIKKKTTCNKYLENNE